jgi:hypothetical protein
MTLSEFLLARIADDERWARARRDEDFRKHRVSARRPHLAPDDAERVLTDCEANRALILELDRMERDEMGWDGVEAKVMGYLALAYAEHPDYREEWRP